MTVRDRRDGRPAIDSEDLPSICCRTRPRPPHGDVHLLVPGPRTTHRANREHPVRQVDDEQRDQESVLVVVNEVIFPKRPVPSTPGRWQEQPDSSR